MGVSANRMDPGLDLTRKNGGENQQQQGTEGLQSNNNNNNNSNNNRVGIIDATSLRIRPLDTGNFTLVKVLDFPIVRKAETVGTQYVVTVYLRRIVTSRKTS